MYCKFAKINGETKPVYQIARFDGRGSFLEILASMSYLEKQKFIFRFIKYDETKPEGSKYTADISIYIDFDDADALAEMISTNYLERSKLELQKSGTGKTELYQNLGGTSAETLSKRGKSRADGKSESRKFSIEMGTAKPYVFKAQVGPGEIDKDGKGLIVPCGKPEQYIMIGFDHFNLVKFARTIQRKVQAMDLMAESKFQRELKTYLSKDPKNDISKFIL